MYYSIRTIPTTNYHLNLYSCPRTISPDGNCIPITGLKTIPIHELITFATMQKEKNQSVARNCFFPKDN